MIIPVDIQQGNLPINYSAGPQQFFKDYKARLRGKLSSSQVLVGFVGPTNPGYDAGPWLQIPATGSWILYYWDKLRGGYYPVDHKLGTGRYKVSFAIGSTAGPNDGVGFRLPIHANGVAATTLDLYVPRATTVAAGTGISINNSLYGNHFFHRLVGDSIYTFTLTDALKTYITIQNNGTRYTATFLGVQWPNVVPRPPVIPIASTAATTATGIYCFFKNNGVIYGEVLGSYSSLPVTAVDEGGPGNNPNYNPIGHVGLRPGQLVP